jgi:hypothetical protein
VVAHYKPRITIDPSWELVELGEVAVVDWGNTSLTKEAFSADGEFIGVSAAGPDGRISHYEHEHGVTVISAIGALCGKVFYPESRFTAIKNTMTLTPRRDRVHPRYLYLAVSDDPFTKRGAAQPFLSKGDTQKLRIPLPPFPVQERIVAALEEERRLVEAARALAERMEARVRERIALVWSPLPAASAADGDGGSDVQRVEGSEHTKPGQGHHSTAVPPVNYDAPDMQQNAAAEPPPMNGTAHPTERRKPGRPPKGDATTAQAQEAIATYLSTHPGWHGKSAVLEATGVDAANWNAAISALLESGKVERQGENKGARYRGR